MPKTGDMQPHQDPAQQWQPPAYPPPPQWQPAPRPSCDHSGMLFALLFMTLINFCLIGYVAYTVHAVVSWSPF